MPVVVDTRKQWSLRYAERTAPGTWLVESAAVHGGARMAALALDSGGARHVFYGSGIFEIAAAVRTAPGTWPGTTVIPDLPSASYASTGLEADAAGDLHACFQLLNTLATPKLQYAERIAGTWHYPEPVATIADDAGASLAIGPDRRDHHFREERRPGHRPVPSRRLHELELRGHRRGGHGPDFARVGCPWARARRVRQVRRDLAGGAADRRRVGEGSSDGPGNGRERRVAEPHARFERRSRDRVRAQRAARGRRHRANARPGARRQDARRRSRCDDRQGARDRLGRAAAVPRGRTHRAPPRAAGAIDARTGFGLRPTRGLETLGTLPAGPSTIAWDPGALAPGVYLLRAIDAGGAFVTRRWVAL
jgi:hypothetical protein